MKSIFITGGTGFIGSFLVPALISKGYSIILTSRNPKKLGFKNITTINWDILSQSERIAIIEKSNAVINLAGAGIADEKWSPERKLILHDSRVNMTKSITDTIALAKNKPNVLISASAVGFYGNRGDTLLNEHSPKGEGFLSDLCNDWEEAAMPAASHTRLVQPRIGVVLHPKSGALQKMIVPFNFFVGGKLGNGKQYMPWVHINDLINMFIFVLENTDVSGIVNFSSPNPTRGDEFAKSLGRAMNRPALFPVPEFILKIILGESSAMVLDSQRAIPAELNKAGFSFKFDNLDSALKDLL